MSIFDSLATSRLYGILDMAYVNQQHALTTAQNLIEGGADILQLRAKNWDIQHITELAQHLVPLCRKANIPCIINDHVDVTLNTNADGVHLGQDDDNHDHARAILGPHRIIGRSTHNLDQLTKARNEGFNYLAFGPLYPTPTKPGRPAIGLNNIRNARQIANPHFPLFCIGGINSQTLPDVIAAGANRVVIVSALLKADNITTATAISKSTLPA